MNDQIDQLARAARQHHGLFRFDEAEALGISRRTLLTYVASGWCDRPWRGVYRLRGAPETPDQRLLAAVWFCGADAVGSHRAGARLWRTPGFGGAGPEVTKPRGRSQRQAYGLVHGSLVLPSTHVTTKRSIAVTTPARTVFDLAGVVTAVWKAQRVVVELDSRKHHTSLLARDSDRRRDNELMAAGWRVIRVTWEDLRQRPQEVVRWIRTALEASARLQA